MTFLNTTPPCRADLKQYLTHKGQEKMHKVLKKHAKHSKEPQERPQCPQTFQILPKRPKSLPNPSQIPPKTLPNPSPNLLKITILCNFNLESLFSQSLTPQGLPNPPPRPSKLKAKSIEKPFGKKHCFSNQIFIDFYPCSTSKSIDFSTKFRCILQ